MAEPAEPTAPTEPNCGNCSHYRRPKEAPPAKPGGITMVPAPAATVVQMVGTCQRFPEAMRKIPSEICGEHPRLALLRDQQLAGLIATQLEEIITAPPAPAKKGWRP